MKRTKLRKFTFTSGDLDQVTVSGRNVEEAFRKAVRRFRPKGLGLLVEIFEGEPSYAATSRLLGEAFQGTKS